MSLDKNLNKEEVAKLVEMLRDGTGIEVKKVNSKKILRIEWFNLVYFPTIVLTISKLLYYWILKLNLVSDAISSIETSGTKYALTTSIFLNLPFFPIYKSEKITFKKSRSVSSASVTQNKEVNLVTDEEIVKKFKRIILIDDIRRTSRTFSSAISLINSCGSKVEACFSILDFKFSSDELLTSIDGCKYYSLFIISEVYEDGKCNVKEGLALDYLRSL
ncbi:MAG: phosphoribosyltransferase [Thermoproteota archaeon]|nr:phosphoribosyltransferase [Candidatus Brockarchaeota archaeon]MBO3801102.1 phosphoribosyltransferase [Candidatus Brockarchaeota archaeon]